MKVLGPNWPSTQRLKTALVDIVSTKTLRWGLDSIGATAQLFAFNQHNTLSPTWTQDPDLAKQWVQQHGKIVFGRKHHHTQGTDIQPSYIYSRRGVKTWNPKWLRSDFWTTFYESINEYRQHIFNGLAIRSGKKISTSPPTRNLLVRSRRNGWTLDYGEFPRPTNLHKISKLAVEACGYLMGAVDILELPDHKLLVLEVNSAPSLRDDATLAAYVRAIKKWA